MNKFKILVILFFALGCVEHNSKKNNQSIDQEPLNIKIKFIKTVNLPYFLSTLDIKIIKKQDVVFFDDNFIIKNGKEKSVVSDKYLVKLIGPKLKCCFKTGFTDILQLITKEDDLKIGFKHKAMIKFIGYKTNDKEMECYFKISSSNNFIYLTINKNISNKKFLFEITDYLKINNNLY